MKHIVILAVTLLVAVSCSQTPQWTPAGDHIMTQWGESLNPQNPLPEYPRPQMERSEWKNLNGLWDYCLQTRGVSSPKQMKSEGKILVPFPIESALSGVGIVPGAEKELWYTRKFDIPTSWKGKRIMLNFGAVDWQATVYVNDKEVGTHTGGYTAFSLDITDHVNIWRNNKLTVKVVDPTNKGYQAIGKQTLTPRSIWYTSVTGIWQTVWMEPVSDTHIDNVKILPDIDRSRLVITPTVIDAVSKDNAPVPSDLFKIKATLYDGTVAVSQAEAPVGESLLMKLGNMRLWSPDSPFLYGLKLQLIDTAGIAVDDIDSYAAMRKISTVTDAQKIRRIQLNDSTVFQMGTLDQGWWPDGLYTAPSDEALAFDIIKTKELGFNTIRKHVKVEPQRWYYLCDSIGMMVWQDMPSSEIHGSKWDGTTCFLDSDPQKRSDESKAEYIHQWKEIIDQLYSHPCVVTWVPFNEAWGQFDTKEIANMTKNYDPSRLLNTASGGNHLRTVGDILDIHNYPQPEMYFSDKDYVNVLGEFGGIGLPVEEHLWKKDTTNKNWGYISMQGNAEVTRQYLEYIDMLKPLIEKGFAAAIYTQTTDVEIEVNGLMTYDRKVLKVDPVQIRFANQSLK